MIGRMVNYRKGCAYWQDEFDKIALSVGSETMDEKKIHSQACREKVLNEK